MNQNMDDGASKDNVSEEETDSESESKFKEEILSRLTKSLVDETNVNESGEQCHQQKLQISESDGFKDPGGGVGEMTANLEDAEACLEEDKKFELPVIIKQEATDDDIKNLASLNDDHPGKSENGESEAVEIKAQPTKTSFGCDASERGNKKETAASVSICDYLYGELRRGYLLENDEQRYKERREKFYTFFKIPKEIEKFISYGFFQCVDAFLFFFTFLPLRSSLSMWFLVTRSLKLIASALFASHKMTSRLLQPAEICDLIKGLIVISVGYMMTYLDTSMIYHIVKSQSVIKLYIMFNMLEVADKLFSSCGQDILDALYWTATERRGRKREHFGVLPHLAFSIGYVFVHSVIVLLQATTLNVAINSQNKALLTIMLSNNFVELKSMVFKKFEKNNLFQMSCSDVRERFHYLILLFIVIVQTMKEYNWNYDQFMVLFPYCIAVLGAEVIVDWTKHAFITRFNEISYTVYRDYTVNLAYDLASCKLKNAFSDHSDMISRRMGFIPLPLGALVLRVVIDSIPISGIFGFTSLFLFYLCLVSMKIWISIVLLGKACSEIEEHRNSQKKKLPPRQCNSLPSSRHHSSENLQAMDKRTKSVPQSQSASVSSSLADIAAQVEIRQETMEHNVMFSNSTVSLDNIGGLNDNVFGNETFPAEAKVEVGEAWRATATFGGILRAPSPQETLKRRISLQERPIQDS